MAALTTVTVNGNATQTALTPVAGTITTGDTFFNDGDTYLLINGGTAGGTLTVKTNGPGNNILGRTLGDKVYTLASGTKTFILPPSEFPVQIVGTTVTVIPSVATILYVPFNGV